MKLTKRIIAMVLCLLMISSGTVNVLATENPDIVIAETPACTECGQTEGHLDTCSYNATPASTGCAECGEAEGHLDTCSEYVAPASPCPTCGVEGCTSGHENWCVHCKVDNCGLTHEKCDKCLTTDCKNPHEQWCEYCRQDNCGKTHVVCDECSTVDGHLEGCTKNISAEPTKCDFCGMEGTHAEGCHAVNPCETCGQLRCAVIHENWCAVCNTENCGQTHVTCDECTGVDGHKDGCTKYVAPPAVPTFCETLIAAESVADIYSTMMAADESVRNALTSAEIDAIFARIDALDPLGVAEHTEQLVDMLLTLPNFQTGAEQDGEIGDVFAGQIFDDFNFTKNDTVNEAVTIANNDTGGEANWSIDGNYTVTINKTVTIPKDQSLDVLVGKDGSTGTIKAGSLGSSAMFIVNGRLKIAKTTSNDNQNHGSITINGGVIQVNSGGELYLEDITAIEGTTTFDIKDGAKLLILGDIPVNGNLTINGPVTIKRTFTTAEVEGTKSNDSMFQLTDGARLTLNNVTIDGENRTFYRSAIRTNNNANPATTKTYITLKNSTIKNSTSQYHSAAITLENNGNVELNVDGCTFENLNSTSGAAIYFLSYIKSKANIKNSLIQNCTTIEGGTIRTNGAGGVNAIVEQCVFKNNIATKDTSHGGAIYWNACGIDPDGKTAKMEIWDSQFFNNKAIANAGAIFNESFMDIGTRYSSGFTKSETTPGNIKGTLIQGNHAKNGGGIMIPTYGGGMEPHNGVGAKLALKTGVFIVNNTAEYGGGLAMVVAEGSIGNTPEDIAKVEFEINLEGAVIENNTATVMGGGMFLKREAPHDLYPSTVNLSSGTIAGNTAPKGGGVCVYNENNKPSTKKSEVNIGSASGTLLIENNTATNGYGGAVYISYGDVNMSNGTIQGNSAKYGGAICVDNGEFGISGGTLIKNSASETGGAVYVAGGDFEMTGGSIGAEGDANTAVNGGAVYVTGGTFTMKDGTIAYNTASNDGGAAYVTGGTFTMENGAISHNTASANGGGAYVAGTASVKGNFVMKNGTLSNNIADKAGGAAYVSGGDFDMTTGYVKDNEAINGGGIYVNGGNFKMISGQLTGNEVKEVTSGAAENRTEGYGGGVYVAGGSVYVGVEHCTGKKTSDNHTTQYTDLPHPVVTGNTAVFGGALAVNGGNVFVYCGTMTDNISDNDGTGKNVFMDGANSEITHYLNNAEIGEMENHGMVSVGGKLHIIHGQQDEKIITITYYENSEGGTGVKWDGEAPDGYWLNLPYCPKTWQDDQDAKGKIFVGWATTAKGTTASEIRKKGNYNDIGTPVEIKDITQTEDDKIEFYAVWAPKQNTITYKYSIDGVNIAQTDDGKTSFAGLPTEYTCSNTSTTLNFTAKPTRAGFEFKGWKMYASKAKISNWDMDAQNYEPTLIAEIKPFEANSYAATSYELLRTFGNITMVAVFKEIPITINYEIKFIDNCNGGAVLDNNGIVKTETIGMATGAPYVNDAFDYSATPGPVGAGIDVNPGYKFTGWFEDEAFNEAVNAGWVDTDNKLTPQKEGTDQLYEERTYYARIEWDYVDVVIQVQEGAESFPTSHTPVTVVFTGTRADNNETITLNVAFGSGDTQVTVKSVPVGIYKAYAKDDWAWRYNAAATSDQDIKDANQRTFVVNYTDNTNDLWLNGYGHAKK